MRDCEKRLEWKGSYTFLYMGVFIETISKLNSNSGLLTGPGIANAFLALRAPRGEEDSCIQ